MWGMNDDVRAVIRWDAELADCYRVIGVALEYQPWEGKKQNNTISNSKPGQAGKEE
jgi:hypothetical protein